MNIKHLVVIFFLALFLAVMLFSCVDPVIGDSPIVVVGDTVYVFLQDGDEVFITYNDPTGFIWVDRPYIDDAVIRYDVRITYDLNDLLVTFPSGRVYPFILYKDDDEDNLSYSFRFETSVNWSKDN